MLTLTPLMSSQERDELHQRIRSDTSLVVPGNGAEGVVLGEEIDGVLQRYRRDGFRVSRPPAFRELFKDVFNVDSEIKIVFDSLYFNEEKRVTLCVLRERVTAVIGLNGDRFTTDGVDLKKGINHFIFHYGNRDLAELRGGSNGIYLYPHLGIGAVDDGMNDSVDIYVVFPPSVKL